MQNYVYICNKYLFLLLLNQCLYERTNAILWELFFLERITKDSLTNQESDRYISGEKKREDIFVKISTFLCV